MTKIITCSELRYRTLAELEALFRTLQIELRRTAPGSPERSIVLASLDSVRRAMAARLDRHPKPWARALWSALEAARILPAASGPGFKTAGHPVRSEARCFRAVRRARNGRDWRPPRSSADRRSPRCCSNYAA